MANSITFTVNIDDKGSLSLLTKESKKAADGIDKVDKTTKKAGKTSDKYSKQNKGVAGATSNGTKAFSKMTTGINTGIVPAYATLAANIFAVSAAFGALKRVAAFDQLVEGFQRTANESGQTASIVTRNLQLITDGAISSEQAFKSAAVGFSAGFSTAEIEGLTQVAKGASLALGRDMGDALDRLVRGTAKLEPEILDELGIFVRLDDAVKQYAESIGKTAGQLTQTERRQSFLNATLTQGKLKFAAVSESVDVNPYDRLAATFDSLSKTLIRLFDNVLGPFISFFANSQVALLGGLVLFSSTITSTMFPALDKLGGKFQRSASAASESTKELLNDQKKLISGAKKEIKESSGVSKRSKFHKIQAKLIAKEKVGLEELRIAEKSLGQSSARRALKLEKLGEKATQAKKDELALINRQREAVEKLIQAEQGRAPLQRKAQDQAAVSSREGAVATAAGKIQEGGALDGFKTARTGLQEYREKLPDVQKEVAGLHKRQGLLGNIMRKGAVASRLASVAVRLFGTALVNAIPFIGQIIMALGFVITGLKALYNWIMKPSAAMQEFNDVIDGMDEKMKQLKETNSKLVTTYTEILLEAESLKVGMEDLSDETVANTVALAANMASGTAYANTLKVNSGIVGEFTNAMSKLTQEFKEDPSGLSTIIEMLDFNIFDKVGAALGRIAGHMKKLAEMSFGKLKDILVYIAGIWGKVIDTVAGEGTSAMVVDTITGAVESASTAISTAWTSQKLETNVAKFLKAQLGAFEKLKESNTELGASMENELGMSYEQFILNSMKGVKTQAEFEVAMSLVQGKLTGLSNSFKKSASDILDFGKNVGVGSKAMAAFGNKMKKKNEFRELGKDVQSSIAAIQNLKGATEGSDGKASFLAELKKAAMAGEVSFEDFGLTAEIIAEKGVDAFTPLQDAITAVADESEVAKNAIARIKSELKGLQDAAKNKALKSLFDNKTANLLAYGRFELSLGQKIKDNKAIYEDQMKLNADVDKKKKDLIDRQFKLEGLKLDMLKLQHAGNDEALKIIAKMRTEMEGNVTAQKAVVTTGTQGADAGAKNSFFERQQSNSGSAGASRASTGSGVTDALRDIDAQFTAFDAKGNEVKHTMTSAFGTFDEKGTLLLSNFREQIGLTRQVLGPLITDLKQLGPDGAVASALGEGMLVMIEGFGNFADTIQEKLGDGVTDMDSFKSAMSDTNDDAAAKHAVMAAGFSMAAQGIGAIANLMAASSQRRVAGIDKEIEAEKNRDGKSAASIAKIAKLEAKKEAVKKKAFEIDKKLRIAQAIMSTAAGVAAALAGGPLTAWMAPYIAALGAVQIGIIAGTSYQGGGAAGGGAGGVASLEMGKRNNTVDLGKGNSASGELGYMRGEEGKGTGATNFKPGSAFTGAKYRASGGETAGFMVGEQGPEMFIPDRSGRIAPADETAARATTSNVNFNISAVDAAGVEDVLVRQKGHIIRMIREAANEHGQPFLEDISDGSYTS